MPQPETSIAALTIQLFGPMQVLVHGQPLPALRSRKMLWLLALLTLRPNRPVEREWLAGTLWPNLDQSQAFANLRPILSGLRSALGGEAERLQSPSRRTLLLDLADADVDVLTFDAAMASKQLSALEQAVTLYRGPLLEGCIEEWIFQERAVREQNCLQALQTLGDAAVSAGDYATAVGYYQRAVRLDPWWEAARRGWMEALAKSGDTNAALQVYREFVEVLRSDPKAIPDEQTSALYQRLRIEVRQRAGTHAVVTAQAVAVPVVKGYLPHPLTDLVGREDERLEVALQLRQSRLVTLTGFGGIGKTRLAREVAGEVVGEYADGVWLVSLEALSESRQVVHQIATVLGLREERGRTPLQNVTEHLRPKRLLLVLDNCEHLLEASAQVVAHLLEACAQMRILATSREALGIPGEIAWSVPVLAVPDTQRLPQGRATLLRVVRGYESVQLFVERAQAIQKSFALNDSNARTVAQVCRQLDGIPLAIELAAARVKVMTVEQIASRLDDHLGLLTVGSRTAQPRQQTLRATLDWSYALLSEAERSLLRRLSVFADGCTLEATERVCGGEGVEAGQVLNLLTSLTDKSLVIFEDRGLAEGRYRLLEMVRQYAATSLQASGEAEQIKRKHRDWFVAFAEAAEPQLKGVEQASWLQRLEKEHDNLRVALTWSETEAKGAQTGLRLVGALFRFWLVRGDFNGGRASLGRALEREGAQEATVARAKALNGAGALACSQGDNAFARALNEEALTIQRELGDKEGMAVSLNYLGNVAINQGDYETARTRNEESLTIQTELGDRRGIANSLNALGSVAYYLANYEAARTLFEEGLAIRRELGDRWGIANSLNALGSVAYCLANYEAARTLYEESLAIQRELGDKGNIALSLNTLGLVANQQGDYEAAITLFSESFAIRRELGDRQGIANSLSSLGDVALNQGDDVAAQTYFEEAMGIDRAIGNRAREAMNLGNLGIVAHRQGDYVAARSLFEQSLAIRQELGDRLGIAVALEAFARLALKEESGERAARLWGAASVLRKSIGSRLPPNEQEDQERDVAAAREAMGEAAFAAAWEDGCALICEEAVAYALRQDNESIL